MIAAEQKRRENSPISIIEHGIMTPARIFGFDTPKTGKEHCRDFYEIGGGAKLVCTEKNELAIKCGVQSGLVVIQVGANSGNFVPNLKPGNYGVEHTPLGNLVIQTKRIIDVNSGTTHLVFGIVPDQWQDGLNSCTLVAPDRDGQGAINLLADDSTQPIEPTPGYRFYTPFYHHIRGAGSAFLARKNKDSAREVASTYPLYRIGIMTLDRMQLSELLRAFNKNWTNGVVFARKNRIGGQLIYIPAKKGGQRSKQKKEGPDKWC